MRRLMTVVAVATLGCGGGGDGGARPAESATAVDDAGVGGAPAPSGAVVTGPKLPGRPPDVARADAAVHEVKMGAERGRYYFEPATLTIKPGDIVQFVNLSGGPHNIQFKKDRIPAGAAQRLRTLMPGMIGDLQGPFLVDSLSTYSVPFGGLPPGTYAYTCTPHEVLGMNGTITVQP